MIDPQDIGIITPYVAQVRKIRRLLQKEGIRDVKDVKASGIRDVKVASVEEFQGQVCPKCPLGLSALC